MLSLTLQQNQNYLPFDEVNEVICRASEPSGSSGRLVVVVEGGGGAVENLRWRDGSLLPVIAFSTTDRVHYQCFKEFWVYLSIKWWYTDFVFPLDRHYKHGEILLLLSGKKAKWHQCLLISWHLTSQIWCSRFWRCINVFAFYMNTYLRITYHIQIEYA